MDNQTYPSLIEPYEGQLVEKVGGDYFFRGFVVCKFNKRSGHERVVVENADGVLHIFNPTQLRVL